MQTPDSESTRSRPSASELEETALRLLGHTPTSDQETALRALADFAVSPRGWQTMVVNGHAGSGKTSMLAALVAAMKHHGMHAVVLAPTGRAAKVASSFSGGKTSTIHKEIYRLNPAAPTAEYFLGRNPHRDTLFFIDEASMVTDSPSERRSVLRDLLHYVYTGPGCAAVFCGDDAQLPPIGQEDSPAMNTDHLAKLGLKATLLKMSTTVRQLSDSGVLYNATLVRRLLEHGSTAMPNLRAGSFPDVEVVSSYDLADTLAASYASVGQEETIVVTRSNNRANRYNQAIRANVIYADEPIQRGERLIVTRNNYFWLRNDATNPLIANGDIMTVEYLGRPEKVYGRWFCDADVRIGASEEPLSVKIMLRSLGAEGAALPTEEITAFRQRVLADIEGTITEKLKAVDNDPYCNALEVKYAYCLTCHKAQGGQWRHVYIDLAGIAPEAMGPTFYRWLYTAITRATERLYIVNPSIPTE